MADQQLVEDQFWGPRLGTFTPAWHSSIPAHSLAIFSGLSQRFFHVPPTHMLAAAPACRARPLGMFLVLQVLQLKLRPARNLAALRIRTAASEDITADPGGACV